MVMIFLKEKYLDKKGLFFSTFIYLFFLILIYYLIYPRVDSLLILSRILIFSFFMLFFLYFIGILLLIFGFAVKKIFLFPLYRYYVLPLASTITGIFSRDKKKKWEKFIKLNNKIIEKADLKIDNRNMILLLPHCLQNTRCDIRITTDIDNCKKCGLCEIGELKKIKEKYDIETFVVTGGTLARRVVREKHPDGIVAVACHHDLKEGIELVYPIPVYGVLNRQPEGPCVNTRVDIDQIVYALENIFKIKKIKDK